MHSQVHLRAGSTILQGNLDVPEEPQGAVLFAHGSGSSRHSPRNRYVAQKLNSAGLATLLIDLLSETEEENDQATGEFRFDIGLLADRLVAATDWLSNEPRTAGLSVGYFGASTGGGAALVAATRRRDRVDAVVSRGGRPDLAGAALADVRAATLLIVGGDDPVVIRLNDAAFDKLGAAEKDLVIIPGASHLFREPGTLEEVARLAADWFQAHLRTPALR